MADDSVNETKAKHNLLTHRHHVRACCSAVLIMNVCELFKTHNRPTGIIKYRQRDRKNPIAKCLAKFNPVFGRPFVKLFTLSPYATKPLFVLSDTWFVA